MTAYPLEDSGYYVIARTWYADEMKRPGCVWTHSLLIPFDELNTLDDFRRISGLFSRPSNEKGFDDYSRTIEYENRFYSADDYVSLDIDRRILLQVLLAFLKEKSSPLIMEAWKDNHVFEDALLATMNTLPLGLLQNVSWCSGTSYIRKVSARPLSCQFVSRISIVNYRSYVDGEEKWQTYVLDAIMRGDVNQGQLIRMFAEDIGNNPDYLTAIVKTLYTLDGYFNEKKTKEQRYKDVLGIIVRAFPDKGKGRVIKKLLVNKSFSDRYCKSFAFMLSMATLPVNDAFNSIETGLDNRWDEFLNRERGQYLSLLGEIFKSGDINKWGIDKLKESVDVLSSEEVVDMIKNDFRLFNAIVLLNPKLLNRTPWQMLSNLEIESILPIIVDDRTRNVFRQWDRLFSILLEKDIEISSNLAEVVFEKTDKATAILLDYVNKDASRCINQILILQISRKTDEVLNWLDGVNAITEKVGYALANAVNEHSDKVLVYGARVWRPFLGLKSYNLDAKVYAFLFALSFNWPTDRDAIELMRMAFPHLHSLQANKQLGYSNWLLIAPYMESVMIWDEWDYCKKLRKTVVKRLKKAGADIHILDSFTPDASLNEELKRIW